MMTQKNHAPSHLQHIKRWGTAALALSMLLTLILPLAACAQKPALDLGLDEVAIYDSTTFDLGDTYSYIQNMIWANNEIIAMAQTQQGLTELLRISTEGQIVGKVPLTGIPNLMTEAGQASTAYIDGLFSSPTGNLIVTATDYSDSLQSVRSLYEIDETGAVIRKQDIFVQKNDGSTTDYLQNLIIKPSGETLLVFSNRVELLDSSGQKTGEYKLDGSYVSLAMFLPNGNLGLSSYLNEGGIQTIEVDLKTGTKVADLSLPPQFFNSQPQLAADGQYYLNGYQYLSRYDAASNQVVKILSWLDLDLNRNNLGYYWANSPDGTLYFIETIYPQSSQPDPETGLYPNPKTNLIRLVKSADQSAVKKTTLSIGAFWLSESLRKAIIEFRKVRPDIRFTVYDYSEGIDYSKPTAYDDAIARINADIIAGKMPDIMIVNNIPWRSYADKGLLLDIGARMAKDKEFDSSLYLTNYFDAMKQNGKLYTIATAMGLSGIIANRSVVGDRTSWTVQDFQNLVNSQPDQANVFYQMPGESILNMLLMGNLDAFVDKTKGIANFDSPEFISLLEFAKKYGVPQDQMGYQEGDGMMPGDYVPPVFQTVWLSRFEDYATYNHQYDGQAAILGYPSPKQTGPMLQASSPIAVAANSRNLDEIWEFLKFTLSPAIQDQVITTYEGFPVLRSSLEKAGAQAIIDTQKQWEDNQKQQQQNGTLPAEGAAKTDSAYWGEIVRVTQQDVDQVMSILNSATALLGYDEKANQLIYEETTPFFAGQKNAAQTAASIQSRLKAYIGEQ